MTPSPKSVAKLVFNDKRFRGKGCGKYILLNQRIIFFVLRIAYGGG